jgi:hypothetical protein
VGSNCSTFLRQKYYRNCLDYFVLSCLFAPIYFFFKHLFVNINSCWVIIQHCFIYFIAQIVSWFDHWELSVDWALLTLLSSFWVYFFYILLIGFIMIFSYMDLYNVLWSYSPPTVFSPSRCSPSSSQVDPSYFHILF